MDKYVDNLLSNLDNTLDFEKEVNKLEVIYRKQHKIGLSIYNYKTTFYCFPDSWFYYNDYKIKYLLLKQAVEKNELIVDTILYNILINNYKENNSSKHL